MDKKSLPAAPTDWRSLPRSYLILQGLAAILLVVAFAAPWIYGQIGKRSEYGWQPVLVFLTFFVPLNIFVVAIIVHCYFYLELVIRLGGSVIRGAIRWIGAFLVLIIVVPVIFWLLLPFDFTQHTPIATNAEGTLGWGAYLAIIGLIIQIVALRLRIAELKRRKA